jgi:acyl-CoA synthetase (AMP-forming)/AMP-acid ligase II
MTAVGTTNIASHLAVMAEKQPDALAVAAPLIKLPYDTLFHSKWTFRQLNEFSDVLASGFKAIGITRAMHTAVCVRPGVEFFAITFALFKLGAVPVLIDPGIGIRNFGRCLAEAEPVAFIGIPAAHLARRLLLWARKTVRINVTTEWFGGVSLKKVRQLGSEPSGSRLASSPSGSNALMVDSAPHDPAAILFTSGSTGPPKGVLYTHGNFDAQVRSLRDTYDIRPGEVDLATFPLFGLFGPALGMTTVIPTMDFTRPGQVNPRNILEPIMQLNVTNMFGSPALLDRVGQWGVKLGIALPSLKRVISAGAPVPAGVIERFASMLSPGTQVFTPYGATESLPVSSIGSDEILGETRRLTDEGKGVCVGRPVAGMRVKIIRISDEAIENWSDDLELPVEQIGEIVVQGDAKSQADQHDRAEQVLPERAQQ